MSPPLGVVTAVWTERGRDAAPGPLVNVPPAARVRRRAPAEGAVSWHPSASAVLPSSTHPPRARGAVAARAGRAIDFAAVAVRPGCAGLALLGSVVDPLPQSGLGTAQSASQPHRRLYCPSRSPARRSGCRCRSRSACSCCRSRRRWSIYRRRRGRAGRRWSSRSRSPCSCRRSRRRRPRCHRRDLTGRDDALPPAGIVQLLSHASPSMALPSLAARPTCDDAVAATIGVQFRVAAVAV